MTPQAPDGRNRPGLFDRALRALERSRFCFQPSRKRAAGTREGASFAASRASTSAFEGSLCSRVRPCAVSSTARRRFIVGLSMVPAFASRSTVASASSHSPRMLWYSSSASDAHRIFASDFDASSARRAHQDGRCAAAPPDKVRAGREAAYRAKPASHETPPPRAERRRRAGRLRRKQHRERLAAQNFCASFAELRASGRFPAPAAIMPRESARHPFARRRSRRNTERFPGAITTKRMIDQTMIVTTSNASNATSATVTLVAMRQPCQMSTISPGRSTTHIAPSASAVTASRKKTMRITVSDAPRKWRRAPR